MKEKILKKWKIWLLFVFLVLDWILLYQIPRSVSNTETVEKNREAQIYSELMFFPIPKSSKEKALTWAFVDSWMGERTFGGNRQHEGCDIMLDKNMRGIYPVVSMTDGTVEKLGWLTLGGYRVGIRSPSGVYYYYAHLESYSETLVEGKEIKAGEFLGFAGDSGYGSEGTVGQFAAHLHVGIYIPDEEGADQAVNPYPYLTYLEDRVLISNYEAPGKEAE